MSSVHLFLHHDRGLRVMQPLFMGKYYNCKIYPPPFLISIGFSVFICTSAKENKPAQKLNSQLHRCVMFDLKSVDKFHAWCLWFKTSWFGIIIFGVQSKVFKKSSSHIILLSSGLLSWLWHNVYASMNTKMSPYVSIAFRRLRIGFGTSVAMIAVLINIPGIIFFYILFRSAIIIYLAAMTFFMHRHNFYW